MLYKTVPKLREALPLVLLIAVVLLATSCSGWATPTSTEPGTIPTTSQPDTVPETSLPLPQFSPGQHLRFDTISLEQGLSLSTVLCMLQDSQGFMWFGTEDGLNKYDGYTFTVYKHDPENPNSVGSNGISALLEDDSGTLWVGTRGGGLDRYDRNLDQFIHYRNDPQDSASLSNDDVTAIHQDQDGELWIGTSGGLDRLVPSHRDVSQTKAEGSDQENERFVHYQHDLDNPNSLSSNVVTVIYEDQGGALWIGTRGGGLNKYDRENERWWHYQNDPNDPHSLSHDNVSAVSEDQSGMLWVGTWGGGLDRLVLSKADGSDQENEHFVHYHHDPDNPESLSSDEIRVLYHDRDGVLWIGTHGGGMNILDREKETFAHYQNVPGDPHSLSSSLILSILQDREGVLWFGTIGGGVSKLDLGWRNFALYQNDPDNPNSLGDNMVWVLYQDREGDLWIGTMLGGLDRFDRETGNWRHYRHSPDDPGSLSNDWVSAVYEDRSGVLWIGTQSGLDRFEPETDSALGEGSFTHYQADPDGPPRSRSNNVIAIHQGREDDFWIGTEGGLYVFDREKESWSRPYRHNPGYPQNLSNDWVLSFLEDRDGMLWIGTANAGLIRFDPEKENFDQHQNNPGDPHSLSDNAVLSILQDQEGALWISTLGGLNRLDPGTGAFTHFRENDGMPNDTVNCTLEDGGGNLWLSTTKGLSRFDPQRGTFRNYDVTDGLQSNAFNSRSCHMSVGGEMFFGGINGFNAFFPDRVNDNPTIPPVVLTFLTQGGDEVDLGMTVDRMTEVTFKWPDNAFEFEFAALSFARPEKNQYAYYLEGFEETWREVGTRRYGQYTNLPGGSYTLRVKGSNNDGVWNEVGTLIEITIVPPFWQTWWFIGAAILVLAGLVFGGYRLRVRNLEARGRELETQVVSRTRELAALNDVASVVSRSLELQQVLTNALEKTLEVVEIEAGGIYLLQDDAQTLNIAVQKGLSALIVAEIDNLQVGEGFSGQVAQTGEPLVVQDLSTDTRLTRSVIKKSGFHSLAITPLVSRGQALGTLFVITSDVREFSQQDVELITSIGGQIGVAVENAKLYERAHQVAVVEERQRMARDLHDAVTQTLFSASLIAETLPRSWERDREKGQRLLRELRQLSRGALAEMRTLLLELRPAALVETSLSDLLHQLGEAATGRGGVPVKVTVEGECTLSPDVHIALYRIAQEALNNAIKHARAGQVTVHLRCSPFPPVETDGEQREQVELVVSDDGRGFDPDEVSPDHLGLGIMHERAEAIGATLKIESGSGHGYGTQIKVTWKAP